MPITSPEIIDFAKDCLSRQDEVGYRNAIARSYYGAYHLVKGMMVNGPKDNHQGLIDYLRGDACRGHESYNRKNLLALSYALQSMKDQRIISDYFLDETVDLVQAQTAIITAEKLVARCLDINSEKEVS